MEYPSVFVGAIVVQSFKYSVPERSSPPPPRKPRAGRVVALVAAVAVLGGLTWTARQGTDGPVATLSWMLGRPAIADERARQADTLLEEGEKSLAASEYAGAFKRFGEALRLNPALLTAWERARVARYLKGDRAPLTAAELVPDRQARLQLLLALADRDRTAGRLTAARASLEEALALSADDDRLHGALGALRRAEGDLDGALAAYERAAKAAPDQLAWVAARFALRLERGEIEAGCQEAVAAYQPHASRDKDDAARIGLLEAYLHMGLPESELAKRLAKDAPQLTTVERQLHLAQAYMHHYLNNPNWHRESFDRVMAAAGDVRKANSGAKPEQRTAAVRLLVEARSARAGRFIDRSDVEAARAELEHALRLAPELPGDRKRFADLQAERARLLTLGGKTDEATRALEAAIKLQADHPCRAELAKVQAGLGITLLSAGKTAAAIGHFRRAVSLSPEDDGLLARYYQALGDKDRTAAVKAVAAAARITDPGAAMARLAHGFSQTHKKGTADTIVSLALAQHVGAGRQAEIRAEALRAAGQRTLAATALQQALEHHPSADLWLRLAAVEAELGEVKARRGERAKAGNHLVAALEASRHALALAPAGLAMARTLEATADLAAHALQAGDVATAERRAAEGRVLAPQEPGLALTHAEALAKLARWDEARQACDDGLAGVTNPGDARHATLRLRHGQALRKLGRPAEAIDTLKLGLAEDTAATPIRCADLWFELAFAHADARQREEALNATRQYVFWSLHDNQQKKRVPAIQELELSLAKP